MKKLSPNLVVTDVKISKEFYEKLRFKAGSLVPDKNNPVFLKITVNGIHVYINNFCSLHCC
ncbi:MAG: hypothetical protein LBP36_01730 [Oscillospiraceae bacterium]|jgi:predicted lactoylglutathione lyase|nr:hypothetical protein [Oscillospiraceae bacterium]